MYAPQIELAAGRLSAGIALGWGWLHAEDVIVRSMSPVGRDIAVSFRYTVVVDREKEEIPADERERFHNFLPMCGEAALNKGDRCSVEETLEFTRTDEYGWMPRAFVEFAPEMLPQILTREQRKH